MKDYNRQIINYWEREKVSNNKETNEQIRNIIKESMEFLKFGCPVRNNEELNEVVKLCVLYHNLKNNPQFIIDKIKSTSNGFDIALSLTDRCGNSCWHCSTNATLANDKMSVPIEALDQALSEIAPYINFLYISCEGDPFYYESSVIKENGQIIKKNIVDVIKLLMKYKYDHISLQNMAPTAKKFHLLEDILDIIDQEKGRNFVFIPQLSFNLYPPRAGLQTRVRTDEKGFEFKELYIPSVKMSEFNDWLFRIIKELNEHTINKNNNSKKEPEGKSTSLSKKSTKLMRYLNDVKSAIFAYASRGYMIHFELRGDTFSEITNLKTMQFILDTLLEDIIKNNPEITFSKNLDSAYIIPLGRATQLFPNGDNKEKVFFDKHVRMNPYNYLCENWMRWGSMTIDTKGFPQLCYSNLALTPKARTIRGPNLYHDGFKKIREFYIKVWEDRINFLKKNLPDLVRQKPNKHYCPLILFKQILSEFT